MMAPMGARELKRYNRTLQRAYPDCRIRWSESQGWWLLERRANFGRLDLDPSKYPAEALDTFIQHRDGYYRAGRYFVDEWPKLPPADVLVQILRANDPDLMDVPGATPEERALNWCKEREEAEAARIAKGRRDNSFEESGAGSDLYNQLAWEEGRRVAVPARATGVGVE